jgi:hypothetical protein
MAFTHTVAHRAATVNAPATSSKNEFATSVTARSTPDNGKSFFPGGVTALESLGFAKHVSYPAPVHQHLSPNDHRLHGTAKARWRNRGVDFEDDVESSLLLLSHLDVELAAHGAMWFRRNILNLTAKSARELMRGRSGNRAQVDDDRLYAYHRFAGLEATQRPEETITSVPSTLHERVCSG